MHIAYRILYLCFKLLRSFSEVKSVAAIVLMRWKNCCQAGPEPPTKPILKNNFRHTQASLNKNMETQHSSSKVRFLSFPK